MTRAAVIGQPISHSLSPRIFACIAGLTATQLRYDAFEIEPEELGGFLGAIREDAEFAGVNITIPHKEAALGLADSASAEARAVGAANVLEARKGRLTAHNTDVEGALQTILSEGGPIAGSLSWIIGAGGAARAVAYALGRSGARRVFVSGLDAQSSCRAEALVREFADLFPSTEYVASEPAPTPTKEKSEEALSFVIHCTPLGMRGVPLTRDGRSADEVFSALPLPLPLPTLPLKPSASTLAFDLIYSPERTPFLEAARARGLRTVGGLDMLISQALATWEIWLGPLGEKREELKNVLRAGLRTELESARPVFLTGFMGVGKSAVGAALARKLGWSALDTDRMIESEAGMPIPEIFRRFGEADFRERERRAVARAASAEKVVVSLGGGALLDPRTLSLVKRLGRLVYLAARPEELMGRLRAGAERRPLLSGLSEPERRARIQAMLGEREPLYGQADFRLDTDGKSADENASALAELVPHAGGRARSP